MGEDRERHSRHPLPSRRSRGRGNVEELTAGNPEQPTVTDDFAAYDTLPCHALCWAHPKRKFQDLAHSRALPAAAQRRCRAFYQPFCALYGDAAHIVESRDDGAERRVHALFLHRRIIRLMHPSRGDPPLFAQQKRSFLAHADEYLLCVRQPGIPMTNNKAERVLRPLVIKRKLSFGSKTQKGADVLSILLSVAQTLWNRHPGNFYAADRDTIGRCRALTASAKSVTIYNTFY